MRDKLIAYGIGLAAILLLGWNLYGWAYDNGQQDLITEQSEAIEKHNEKVKEENNRLNARADSLFKKERDLYALLPKQTKTAYESATATELCFPDDRVQNIIRPNINAIWGED